MTDTSTADRAAFKPGDRVRVAADWSHLKGEHGTVEEVFFNGAYMSADVKLDRYSAGGVSFGLQEIEPVPSTPAPVQAEPHPTDRWTALASAIDAYDAGQCSADDVIRAARALVRPLAPLAEDREAGKPALATTGGENGL